jgi:hypothetical protein
MLCESKVGTIDELLLQLLVYLTAHVSAVVFVMDFVADIPQWQQFHCHYETCRQNAYSHIPTNQPTDHSMVQDSLSKVVTQLLKE